MNLNQKNTKSHHHFSNCYLHIANTSDEQKKGEFPFQKVQLYTDFKSSSYNTKYEDKTF